MITREAVLKVLIFEGVPKVVDLVLQQGDVDFAYWRVETSLCISETPKIFIPRILSFLTIPIPSFCPLNMHKYLPLFHDTWIA